MLRIVTLIVIALVSSSFTSPEVQVNWVTLAQAQQLARDNAKPIFIDFTAEWCGWCKVMDRNTFSDAEVASFMNENFYAVRLDYDSKEKLDFFGEQMTARELGTKYRVPGLPTILLLSSDSKKSKKLVGYKQPEPFLKGLQSFVF
jgi:thioredoxin-related protein